MEMGIGIGIGMEMVAELLLFLDDFGM